MERHVAGGGTAATAFSAKRDIVAGLDLYVCIYDWRLTGKDITQREELARWSARRFAPVFSPALTAVCLLKI